MCTIVNKIKDAGCDVFRLYAEIEGIFTVYYSTLIITYISSRQVNTVLSSVIAMTSRQLKRQLEKSARHRNSVQTGSRSLRSTSDQQAR